MKVDHVFHYQGDFKLEAGDVLSGFQLKYTTLGSLNAARDNAVWVCHALTGSSDFTSWWEGVFTENSPFDPRDYFIICANLLGGCYGSTGPLSINPATGKPYYHAFPALTGRDISHAFDLLRHELRLSSINTLIGGSLGGQHAMEWAIQQPTVFENLILMACNARHSPWGIALNEAQRLAIEADPTWAEHDARAGLEGMKAARAIGMISYRTYQTYNESQAEKTNEKLDDYRAASYQRYQAQKLVNRFNAFTYFALTKIMDSHNVGRHRESTEKALKKINAKTLVVGIDSDLLFPLHEQKFLANSIPKATLEIISSRYGHDGFLVEFDQFKKIIRRFFKQESNVKEVASL
jgi:homoserine O-acetyltransferase/O-succinyltransferase